MPRKSWWARLPFGVRMVAGTSALLIVIGGGVAGVAALTRHDPKPRIVTTVGDAAATGAAPQQSAGAPQIGKGQIGAEAARSRTAAEADRTAPRDSARAPVTAGTSAAAQAASPAETSTPTGKRQPVVTTRTETETREIPYPTRLVRDPSLPRGTRQVQSPGVAGEETLRYLVTLTDGRQTDRQLVDSTVTRQPQQQIVALGDQSSGQGQGQGQGTGPGSGPGGGHWQRGGHRGHCGPALDLCVPLGRAATCPDKEDQRLEDAGAAPLGGEVALTNTDIDVLSGGC